MLYATITKTRIDHTACYEISWPSDGNLFVRSQRTAKALAAMSYAEALASREYRLSQVKLPGVGWGEGSKPRPATGPHGAEKCPF